MSNRGVLTVQVQGRPRPQGSKTVRRGRALEANPHTRAWRDLVVDAVRLIAQEEGFGTCTGPVAVHAGFQFLRPSSGPRLD